MKEKLVGLGVCMLMCLAAVIPTTATESNTVSPMNTNTVKWEQLPDITENGTDVAVTLDAVIPRELADDFLCTTTGPITNVTIWGSWMNDQVMPITNIHVSIHADIPANESPTGYSIPGNVLWQMNFSEGQFTQRLYHEGTAEWWYDPYTDLLLPQADHAIWEYLINIDPAITFIQQGTAANPIVYWLDVYVVAPGGNFGWKTTPTHWNDDAVYLISGANPWQELIYPPGHPYATQSMDMAFRINTASQEVTLTFQPISVLKVKISVLSSTNISNIPWQINLVGNFWKPPNPNFEGVITSLNVDQTVIIQTGGLLGFGAFNLTVTVDGIPPVKTTGFIFLFLILVRPPSPN